MNNGNIIAAFILSLGIAVGGYFVGHGLWDFRGSARSVEVRGLAERHIKADIAVWTVRHGANAISLVEAQEQIKRNSDVLKSLPKTVSRMKISPWVMGLCGKIAVMGALCSTMSIDPLSSAPKTLKLYKSQPENL